MMKKFSWVIISGLLCGFGQPAWMLWLAPVVAVGGFALFWRAVVDIRPRAKRFWVATLWFCAVQLVQLSWMTSIEYQGWYILGVYGALAFGLGIQFGLLTAVMDKIPMVATAAIWTLLEWARLFVFCGFSWNPVGLTLTAVPWSLQAASLFGVLGLSFWVMLTNLACWKRRWKAASALALVPYVLGGVQWSLQHGKLVEGDHLNVALVQTALLPHEKHETPPHVQWEQIVSQLARVERDVDLVVLPEAVVTGSRGEVWGKMVGEMMQADVVMGCDTEKKGKNFSSAVFYAQESKGMKVYHKQILLPLAEYLPFRSLKKWTEPYGIREFFTPGKKSEVFHSKAKIAPSICYEETFGSVMRNGRKKGAGLFVNMTNDNWYPHSRLPKQHFDLARVHAVACGAPLVRACNAGMTSAVDSLGAIVGELREWNRPGILVACVPLHHFATPYTWWGDWGIIGLCTTLLLICFFLNRRVGWQLS